MFLLVVNTESYDEEKFPTLAVYVGRDQKGFRFWARPLSQFVEKFERTDYTIPTYFDTFYNQLKQSWCRFLMLSNGE